jgi:hypothetical protein
MYVLTLVEGSWSGCEEAIGIDRLEDLAEQSRATFKAN